MGFFLNYIEALHTQVRVVARNGIRSHLFQALRNGGGWLGSLIRLNLTDHQRLNKWLNIFPKSRMCNECVSGIVSAHTSLRIGID